MWKNIIEAVRPQMTVLYSTCALHAGKVRQAHTHTHTLIIGNTAIFRYKNISCLVFSTLS